MKAVLTFIILFVSVFDLYGALSIEVSTFPDMSNVLIEQYPYYTAWVKVYKDGELIKVNAENLIIIENNKSSTPVRIADTSGDWQAITWLKKMRTTDALYMDFKIIATVGNESAASFNLVSHEKPSLHVTNEKNSLINEVGFYNVQPGQDIPEQVRIFYSNDFENGTEKKLRVDSIRMHSRFFRAEWLGSDGDGISLPPRLPYTLIPGFRYWINIFFKPDDKSFYEDSLTIYYDNGAQLHVPVFANVKPMPAGGTMLNIVYPNGKERIAPCQQLEIKWRGHSPALPVKLEYSSDGGATWRHVATVQDSVFNWTAPNEPTDLAKFRVSQPYYESNTFALRDGTAAIPSLTFNSTGSNMLSANVNGEISEWNLVVPLGEAPKKSFKYYVEGSEAAAGLSPLGVEYINADTTIVGLYSDLNKWEFDRVDTLVWFKTGQQAPTLKKAVELGFQNSKMIIDSKRELIAIVPKNDTRIAILSATDGSLIRYVDMGSPVLNAVFNNVKPQLAVSLWNGQIKIFSTPDFNLVKSFTFRENTISKEIALSPNGEALLVSGFSIEKGVYHLVNVIDLNTMQIIRNYRPSASNPQKLTFSPNSRNIIIASEYPQQIAIYNVNESAPPNYMNGHVNPLIDCKVSPEGHSLASSSSGIDNLFFRTFSYAESDDSDLPFSIVAPDLDISAKKIENNYLGTSTTHQIVALCNRGDLPFIISSAWMENNVHFKLINGGSSDTIPPGGCKEVTIEYAPSDTGLLEDNIVFDYCFSSYKVKVESYSMPRNLAFSENPFEFGEICVGDTTEREFTFFTNADPAPLLVNAYGIAVESQKEFSYSVRYNDTLLPPGGSIKARVRFHPTHLGSITGEAIVYHSNQTKITSTAAFHGTGIGSFAEMSHDKLLFVPEEPIRKFKIKNTGSTPLTIESLPVIPAGSFANLTPLPSTIGPGEELEIDVKWLGGTQTEAAMQLNATPCLFRSELPLGFYSGTSAIALPNLTVRSTDEAVIPINYVNTETGAYKGVRSFDGAIEVDSKLFMPKSIESALGKSEIVSNAVSNGVRRIEFRVEADFPLNGELCRIHGVPGLSDKTQTPINFVPTLRNWSANVINTYTAGSIKIIPIRDDLAFKGAPQQLLIKSVSPNPATDVIKIDYISETDADVSVELYDALGKLSLSSSNFRSQSKTGSVSINISGLETGVYSLILRSGSCSAKARISIVK